MPIMGEYTKPEADTDIATHAALTTGVHGVGTGTVASKPIDRLAGVLATQSGWNTAPTNLANATDGNWATATGQGIQTNINGWQFSAGYIMFDMGAVYNVFVSALVTLGLSIAGGGGITLKASEDNSTYYLVCGSNGSFVSGYIDSSTPVTVFVSTSVRARYIRLFAYNNSGDAKSMNLGITEIQAVDLGI